jgi:hypothetical protein
MTRQMINMIDVSAQRFSWRARCAMVPFAMLAMWASTGVHSVLAQPSAQLAFPSAAEAVQSLFQAVQSNDEAAIAKILGGSAELISSRDPGQDKIDRELFIQKYQEMHRVHRESDGSVTLYIGAENWPFPIPLVATNGGWRFDTEAGGKEVTFRRIGDNELTAIATCHEFVAAVKQYRASSAPADLTVNSFTSLAAKAANGSAGDDRVLSDGYYFHLLTAMPHKGTKGNTTGSFALAVYPAEYRSSGVMTFVVTSNDVVYEKDLGANTSALAIAMKVFHKDSTWHVANP